MEGEEGGYCEQGNAQGLCPKGSAGWTQVLTAALLKCRGVQELWYEQMFSFIDSSEEPDRSCTPTTRDEERSPIINVTDTYR